MDAEGRTPRRCAATVAGHLTWLGLPGGTVEVDGRPVDLVGYFDTADALWVDVRHRTGRAAEVRAVGARFDRGCCRVQVQVVAGGAAEVVCADVVRATVELDPDAALRIADLHAPEGVLEEG